MRRLEYSLKRDGAEVKRTFDWLEAKRWIDINDRHSYEAEIKDKTILSPKEEEAKAKHREKVAAAALKKYKDQ